VVHYDSPPPTGGDFGTIFMADNMIVTASVVPEPGGLVLLGIGALGFLLLGGGGRVSADRAGCVATAGRRESECTGP
jgi:hypothetical protein